MRVQLERSRLSFVRGIVDDLVLSRRRWSAWRTRRIVDDHRFLFGLARDYILNSDWLEFVCDGKLCKLCVENV